MEEARFVGELREARGGGHVVKVDDHVATSIGAKHLTRVRGVFGSVEYRSNLVKSQGALYLGVHRATIAAAGVAVGDVVAISMGIDPDPRAGDR